MGDGATRLAGDCSRCLVSFGPCVHMCVLAADLGCSPALREALASGRSAVEAAVNAPEIRMAVAPELRFDGALAAWAAPTAAGVAVEIAASPFGEVDPHLGRATASGSTAPETRVLSVVVRHAGERKLFAPREISQLAAASARATGASSSTRATAALGARRSTPSASTPRSPSRRCACTAASSPTGTRGCSTSAPRRCGRRSSSSPPPALPASDVRDGRSRARWVASDDAATRSPFADSVFFRGPLPVRLDARAAPSTASRATSISTSRASSRARRAPAVPRGRLGDAGARLLRAARGRGVVLPAHETFGLPADRDAAVVLRLCGEPLDVTGELVAVVPGARGAALPARRSRATPKTDATSSSRRARARTSRRRGSCGRRTTAKTARERGSASPTRRRSRSGRTACSPCARPTTRRSRSSSPSASRASASARPSPARVHVALEGNWLDDAPRVRVGRAATSSSTPSARRSRGKQALGRAERRHAHAHLVVDRGARRRSGRGDGRRRGAPAGAPARPPRSLDRRERRPHGRGRRGAPRAASARSPSPPSPTCRAGLAGDAAALPAPRPGVAPVPAGARRGRDPRRRHGPRQDDHDARVPPAAQGGRGAGAVARRVPHVGRDQLGARGRALHAGPARARSSTGRRASGRRRRSPTATSSSRRTRSSAATSRRSRRSAFRCAVLDEAQNIKNADSATTRAARPPRRVDAPRPLRHAGREPPRASCGRSRRSRTPASSGRRARSRRASSGPSPADRASPLAGRAPRDRPPVPPPPHEGRGAPRAPAEDRDRPHRDAARAPTSACTTRSRTRCAPASRRTSRSASGISVAQRLHGAHAPPADGVRPAPRRPAPRARRRRERQARGVPRAGARARRRGAARARLLAVRRSSSRCGGATSTREKIAYEYLDGQTTKRDEVVARFQEGTRAALPHLAQGRRRGAQPHRGRHRHPLRPVVEPGGRGPGDRPRLPHRAGQAGDRGAPRRARDDRGEDPVAQGEEARAHAGGHRRRRARARGADRGRRARCSWATPTSSEDDDEDDERPGDRRPVADRRAGDGQGRASTRTSMRWSSRSSGGSRRPAAPRPSSRRWSSSPPRSRPASRSASRSPARARWQSESALAFASSDPSTQNSPLHDRP